MEVEVIKYDSKTKDYNLIENLKIENFKRISDPKSLFIVNVNVTPIENGENDKDTEILEIYKVQFIAACKTKLKQTVLAAFYIGEYSELEAKIITELSEGYQTPMVFLVDYKAYEEMCELTKESKLSFAEYFEDIKTGRIGLNSLIKYQGKYFNHDQQRKLYDSLEEQGK